MGRLPEAKQDFEMPRVSVIIPTYNRSSLVREAVESVLRQTFTNFEIFVVDDGSTDDTASVIKEIPDERIRYFYKENGGVSSARNLGLLKAKGKYVAFLDSDDLWPEHYLETMILKLEENHEYDIAYSLFRTIRQDGQEESDVGSDRRISGWLTRLFYEKPPNILLSATFYRRRVWDELWWDESLKNFEDIDAFLRLSTRAKFLFVANVCITRRVTSDSLAHTCESDFSPNGALVFERFYFHFGGDKVIPPKVAKRWFNRLYRGLAKQHYQAGNQKATIMLFKRAIKYYPFDLKDYRWLLKGLLLSKKHDKEPDWQMPEPLPPYI